MVEVKTRLVAGGRGGQVFARDGDTGVGDAEAKVVADDESSAVGDEVGIGQEEMAGGEDEDLLDVAVAEVGVYGKHEGSDAADVRGGGGGAGKGIQHVVGRQHVIVQSWLGGKVIDLVDACGAAQVRGEDAGEGGVRIAARGSDQDTSSGIAVAGGFAILPESGDGDDAGVVDPGIIVGVLADEASVSGGADHDDAEAIAPVRDGVGYAYFFEERSAALGGDGLTERPAMVLDGDVVGLVLVHVHELFVGGDVHRDVVIPDDPTSEMGLGCNAGHAELCTLAAARPATSVAWAAVASVPTGPALLLWVKKL